MANGEDYSSDLSSFLKLRQNSLFMQSRLIARLITHIHDDDLRRFDIGSSQFAMLVLLITEGALSRADLGRQLRQSSSTLSRNIRLMLEKRWVTEAGRLPSRQGLAIEITQVGLALLCEVEPAWKSAQAKARLMLGPEAARAISDVAGRLERREA